FWDLSQRQRRILVAGLWDGDGSHVFNGEAILAQKSPPVIDEVYHCLTLDGIFPQVRAARHDQKCLVLNRAHDFQRFLDLYPIRHPTKRASIQARAALAGKDKTIGLWKCPGVWQAVAAAALPAGMKTKIYNSGGKYDQGFRAQRVAFAPIPSLR